MDIKNIKQYYYKPKELVKLLGLKGELMYVYQSDYDRKIMIKMEES